MSKDNLYGARLIQFHLVIWVRQGIWVWQGIVLFFFIKLTCKSTSENTLVSQSLGQETLFFFLSKALSWAYISSSKGDVLGNAKRSTVIPCPFSSALCLAYISDLLTCRYSLCIKEPEKKAPTLIFSFKPPFKGILSVTATKKKKKSRAFYLENNE